MNIYELEKQATPGPWEVERDPGGGASGLFPTNILTGNSGLDEVASMIDRDEDAKLIAHCRNNMVPLLKAARRIVNLISDDESRYEAWKEEVEALSDACQKLEEVI